MYGCARSDFGAHHINRSFLSFSYFRAYVAFPRHLDCDSPTSETVGQAGCAWENECVANEERLFQTPRLSGKLDVSKKSFPFHQGHFPLNHDSGRKSEP